MLRLGNSFLQGYSLARPHCEKRKTPPPSFSHLSNAHKDLGKNMWNFSGILFCAGSYSSKPNFTSSPYWYPFVLWQDPQLQCMVLAKNFLFCLWLSLLWQHSIQMHMLLSHHHVKNVMFCNFMCLTCLNLYLYMDILLPWSRQNAHGGGACLLNPKMSLLHFLTTFHYVFPYEGENIIYTPTLTGVGHQWTISTSRDHF